MNVHKRVLIGGLYHESHSFVEGRTRLDEFAVAEGEAILAARGELTPLAGALEVADACGWRILPSVSLQGGAGPIVEDGAVAFWWERFEYSLCEALRDGLDGVYLNLHGAMVSESLPDVEGEMLRRIRAVAGPNVLIAGVTDLHANFTPAMAEFSDALVTYRENPHTDVKETGRRAALLLDRLMKSGERARTIYEQPPLLWPPTGTGTADEPMRSLETMARQVEADDPQVLCANVHAGYSFADTPHTGVSFSIVTVGDEGQARRYARCLARLAMELKAHGNHSDPPPQEVLPQIAAMLLNGGSANGGNGHHREYSQQLSSSASAEESTSDGNGHRRGPVVLVESADNIGGGAPGDGTHLLRAVLEHGISGVGAIINDSQAVARLQTVSLGARLSLPIGGRESRLSGAPLRLQVELLRLHDGRFTLEDPHSHQAASGSHVSMGPCALVRVADNGGIKGNGQSGATILLTSRKTAPFDLAQWRCVGVQPEDFHVILVKAAVAHRQAYDPIARAGFTVNTPGPCTGDLRALPFCRIRRPIYPLDEM